MQKHTVEIYFGGSIRGGRDDQELYKQIIGLLSEYGTVLTEHVGRKTLSVMGEENLTDPEIYSRDMELLDRSQKRVFEVTNPSLGVGYEIAQAERDEGSSLCLYRPTEGKRLSAMIAGNPRLQVCEYHIVEDLRPVFDRFFQ